MLTPPPENVELYKRAYKGSVWKEKKYTVYGNGNKERIFSRLTPGTRLKQLENHSSRGFNIILNVKRLLLEEVRNTPLSLAHSCQEFSQRLHNQTSVDVG